MTFATRSPRWLLPVVILFILALVSSSACRRSPEARKAHYLARGDRYFADGHYHEAIIDYLNVLRIDPTNTRALRNTGLAHFELGELGQSYQFLLRSQQLDPENAEARLKLASIYLAGRKFDEARDEATFVLDKEPANLDALILFAGAVKSPEEVDQAIKRLELARAQFEGTAKFHLALGSLYLRTRNLDKAEQEFKEAVTREPKSVAAHTVLANLHVGKGEMTAAESEFKAAAAASTIGSPARVHLADFYVLLGKPEEGKKILRETTEKAPDFLPAWRRLAEVSLAQRNFDEANAALDGLLKKSPADVDGHLLRGRLYLAKGESSEAIQEFHRVLKIDPQLAPARHQLAVALLQAGNSEQARSELQQVAMAAPNLTEARLLLAELNLRAGAPDAVVEDLAKLIVEQPRRVEAYMLLGSAYRAKRDAAKATQTYAKILDIAPTDPRGPYFEGVALRAQGKVAEAKQQFESALKLNAAYADALSQLVSIAFAENMPDRALERVQKQIQLAPNSAQLYEVLGGVHLARKEAEQAEAAYSKAIELEPKSSFTAYLALAQIYGRAKRHDEALAELDQVLKANPKNFGALMLTGEIQKARGDIPKAQAAYEKIIAEDPRFGPAANNLAYLYSEHGGDKEKALALAQTAKEAMPEDPRVSDTLGWILYKRGLYGGAVRLLTESAAKRPDDAEVQFHLGMAQYKMRNADAAKRALARALELNASFAGREEARQTLSELR